MTFLVKIDLRLEICTMTGILDYDSNFVVDSKFSYDSKLKIRTVFGSTRGVGSSRRKGAIKMSRPLRFKN